MNKPQIWKVIASLAITCIYIFAIGIVGRVNVEAENGAHAIEIEFPEMTPPQIQTPSSSTTTKSQTTISLASMQKPSYADKLPTSQTVTNETTTTTAPESSTTTTVYTPETEPPETTPYIPQPDPPETDPPETVPAETVPPSPTPTSPDDVAVYDREAKSYFYCTRQELLAMATPTRLVVYDRSIGGYAIGDILDIVAAATVGEISYIYSEEAVKANAVCEYTYIRKSNVRGEIADTNLHRDIEKEHVRSYIYGCVEPILGKAVYYGDEMIQCVFTAATCGYSESSYDVWGVDYPYLRSVDSSWEMEYADDPYNHFIADDYTFSSDYIKSNVQSTLGITLTGDPSNWLKVVSTLEGKKNGWVTELSVGGQTTYVNSYGNTRTITGRTMRESVLGFAIPSPAFTIKYDAASDNFIFYIYGSGHGVGFSQFGAHILAKYKGWTYDKILTHYFSGTVVR